MAISASHYRLMLRHRDILPSGGSVLQIGDANWYGDLPPQILYEHCRSAAQREIVDEAIALKSLFAVAKAFYRVLFGASPIESIDLNGSDGAFRLDLNHPLAINRQYDLCINHGTAEHIFNIGQVFRTMHDATKPGGLMIHGGPFQGWPDHGFYSLHPTLFYDLSAACGYELVSMNITWLDGEYVEVESREQLPALLGSLRPNAMLFVVLRKGDAPFGVPLQGIYDGSLGPNGKKAWTDLR